jgi:arabinoxylan arabinofuranohydrolase
LRRVFMLTLIASLLLATGLCEASENQDVRVVVDYSDGYYGWRVFGSGLLELTSEQAKSGNSSLKMTGRTANWNGAALDIDSFLSDAGTYQFSIYVRLVSEQEGVLGHFTVCENMRDGTTNYRWISPEVPLSAEEWVLIESDSYVFEGQDMSSAFLYVETNHATASFYLDEFTIVGDRPLRGSYAALAEAQKTVVDNSQETPLLREAYADRFLIGFATDNVSTATPIKDHFNALTLENRMKWDSIHPQPDQYRFTPADALVDFAHENGMKVIGHTLVWHSQTPDWVFQHPDGTQLTREELLARMEEHIKTVVGHYKGKVYSWDVVNEAIENANGRWGLRDTKWREIIGDDYIEHAFRFAHEADPDAELYYNDYGAASPGKRDAIYEMVKGLIEKGVPIHGIGMQGHWNLDSPSEKDIRAAIELYSSLGLKVSITEMDISVYSQATPYPGELPESIQERQAERYAQCFRIFSDYADAIDRVTFWGTNDRYSWINRVDRPDHPLLFGKQYELKPAFWGVVQPGEPWYVTMGLYEGAAKLFDADGSVIANLIPGEYKASELKALGLNLGAVRDVELARGYLMEAFTEPEPGWAQQIFTGRVTGVNLSDAQVLVIRQVGSFNVLANKPIEASHLPERAGRAVDGQLISSWSPSFEPPYWLVVDLGVPHLLNRWVVHHRGTGLTGTPVNGPINTADFSLQVSNDGVTWHDADVVKDNTDYVTDRTFTLTEARYVRLLVTRPSSIETSKGLVIYEWEVHGTVKNEFTDSGESESDAASWSAEDSAAIAATDSEAGRADRWDKTAIARSYKPIGDHNPLLTHRFGADPYALVYGDRVYVYSTNDIIERDAAGRIIDNTYGKIRSINCISSDDLVNWTDHGWIDIGPQGRGIATWANNSWAPAAAYKNIDGRDRFFLYFSNNANGIGVLTSDSPVGPFLDPIRRPLVSRQTPNSNVVWLFDPAIAFDEEGTPYLYFGGGVPEGKAEMPNTARVVQLGDDMISLAGTPQLVEAPWFFEAAFVHRIGDTYYFSYCTNWASRQGSTGKHITDTAEIAYMTSKSPMGPWELQGSILKNPGQYFGSWGNNHHSLVEFKGKWYLFYHTQVLQDAMGIRGGYRSTHVDELTIAENGTIVQVIPTRKGVAQLKYLNPYQVNEAETMAWAGGITTAPTNELSETFGLVNMAVEKLDSEDVGGFVGVSGVDFGDTSPRTFTAKVSSAHAGNAIKVTVGAPANEAIAYVEVPNTGDSQRFAEVTVGLTKVVTGVHDLFFVLYGKEFCFDAWSFERQ